MSVAWIITALIVPWAAGIAIALQRRDSGMRISLAVGIGWMIGQMGVMAVLYAVLMISGQSHARWILVLFAMAAAVLWARVIKQQFRRQPAEGMGHSHPRQPFAAGDVNQSDIVSDKSERISPWLIQIVFGVIGVSLIVKLTLLAGAHAFVPSRSDDAISIWLFKAKVIATLDHVPTDPSADYYMGGSNPRYPLFAPLLAAWVPLVSGQWNEHLATLPWLGFYLNLPLMIAGGLRRWIPKAPAWIAAYLVASLPLMMIHAYRPGYVDMPLAAFLAATILSLLSWRSSGRPGELILAILFAATAACLKREGPAIIAISVLSIVSLSWHAICRMTARFRVGALLTVAASGAAVGYVVDFSETAANLRAFAFHPDTAAALIRHLLGWSSFHFLFWLVAAAVGFVIFNRRGLQRWPAVLLTVGLLGLDASIFLFTPQVVFALNDQTPSRLFLQAAPAIILALAIPVVTGLRPNGQKTRLQGDD